MTEYRTERDGRSVTTVPVRTATSVSAEQSRREKMRADLAEAQRKRRKVFIERQLPKAMAHISNPEAWRTSLRSMTVKDFKRGDLQVLYDRSVMSHSPYDIDEYLQNTKLTAYTDGSFSTAYNSNSGENTGGFSFIILDDNQNIVMFGGGVIPDGARNSTEFEYAAVHAVLHALPQGCDVVIRTDLQGIVNMVSGGKFTIPLKEHVYSRGIQRHQNVHIEKVRAHHLSLGNHIADHLAKKYRGVDDQQRLKAKQMTSDPVVPTHPVTAQGWPQNTHSLSFDEALDAALEYDQVGAEQPRMRM